MTTDAAPLSQPPFERALRFGRFSLDPARKQLLAEGGAVRLGGRALDLLIALVERAGDVVSHDELFARVWPRTVVEESSLRVHLSALRKALGESSETRYIASVPGRGYSFVMPVAEALAPGTIARADVRAEEPEAAPALALPSRLANVIGRDEVLDALAAKLRSRRLVTIVGPGGIGKTTVALALAERIGGRQRNGAVFVDLAPVGEPALVAAALAAAIGVTLPTEDAWSVLGAALAARDLLVILDNCEHVIAAAAQLAECVLLAAPGVRLLATSREPLDAESEVVYRLDSLALPRPEQETDVIEALGFPALRLFVERATASADDFVLSQANVAAVLQVCRHLDGVPLAIELAAARVGSLGIQALADRLDDVFRLLKRGRRTALPRHQTLQALLDWSHDLLDVDERRVLHRLSAFRASFLLDDAAALASGADIGRPRAVDCILGLVSKSLVEFEDEATPRYRLLFVTRQYAAEKLAAAGESRAIAERHAHCMCQVLARSNVEYARGDTLLPAWLKRHVPAMPDVRAALDWAASPAGDKLLGAALVAESGLVGLISGLSDEIVQRAVESLAVVRAAPAAHEQLELRLLTLICCAGGVIGTECEVSRETAARLQELAARNGTPHQQRLALEALCIQAFGGGDYPRVAALVSRFEALPPNPADPRDENGLSIRHRFGAHSAHYLGDHAAARREAARMLAHASEPGRGRVIAPVPERVAVGLQQARILWIEGRADSALEEALRTLAAAEDASPFGQSQVMAMAVIPVLLWRGDDASAAAVVDRLVRHVRRFGQSFWSSWTHGFCRVLELRGLDVEDIRTRLLSPPRRTSVAAADMLATLAAECCGPQQLERAETGTVGWCAPEILRIQGERLASDPLRHAQAELLLQRSLDLSRRQGAPAWALRAATSLAALWQSAGRDDAARKLLADVLAGFTEGLECFDVRRARSVLDDRRRVS
jgi:predicted ATPase/DNA-binding winged helix-turn-helix (wHTH) protein